MKLLKYFVIIQIRGYSTSLEIMFGNGTVEQKRKRKESWRCRKAKNIEQQVFASGHPPNY